ncbi:ImmA/IrrE family metallo-endopeptidase [Bdellovibrio sp. HCB2-146]|uniref:ImmA/IrrE family metallo-endopeptidase n=1 Tax=Bdellovibrio sp. HCB2-146 TaxID=3394362 RepID=UPI0039BD3159
MDFTEMPVPVVPGLSRKQIEQSALEFLLIVAPECLEAPVPVPVREIFEDRLDVFDYKALVGKNIKGLDGVTNVTKREVTLPSATYKRLENGDCRARFTLAHEFGHMILHGNLALTQDLASADSVMFARRSQLRAFEDPEWQANAFGAAVLMPYPMMRLLYKQGLMSVENVMETFHVSEPAAKLRVTQLKTEFMK